MRRRRAAGCEALAAPAELLERREQDKGHLALKGEGEESPSRLDQRNHEHAANAAANS